MQLLLRLFIYTTISFVFLVGCGSERNSSSATDWEPTIYESVNNLDGVTMAFKEGTITATGGTVILKNDSNKEYVYGSQFSLEKNINGDWYQVPIVEENYGFTDIGYQLSISKVEEWEMDWEWLYGKLETGEYRMVKGILDSGEAGEYEEYEEYDLTAEFTVE